MIPGIADLSRLIPELRQVLGEQLHQLKCAVDFLRTGGQRLASIEAVLLNEYGIPVVNQDQGLYPRQITRLPVVLEDTASAPLELDVRKACQGRAPVSGFYANLGEDPFKIILVGIDGAPSNPHTVPPGTTYPIRSAVTKVNVLPAEGASAFYQLYLY